MVSAYLTRGLAYYTVLNLDTASNKPISFGHAYRGVPAESRTTSLQIWPCQDVPTMFAESSMRLDDQTY